MKNSNGDILEVNSRIMIDEELKYTKQINIDQFIKKLDTFI